MDYEKKYKEALVKARKYMDDGYTVLMPDLFPELKESEDERIRKAIESIIHVYGKTQGEWIAGYDIDTLVVHLRDAFAYLEKQKEYVSDNFDDVWTTEDCAEIIEAGGKLSPRFKELFKEVCHVWYDKGIELGKQKEQNPNIELIQKSWYMEGYHDCEFGYEPRWVIKTGEGGPRYEENPKYGQHIEKQDYSGLNDFERAVHRGFLCAGVENVPVNIIKETAQDCLAHSPVEWSEEDEKIIQSLILEMNKYVFFAGIEANKIVSFLKSLRPSWKPSEEQMEALNALNCHGELSYVGQQNQLISLYNDLKKLM